MVANAIEHIDILKAVEYTLVYGNYYLDPSRPGRKIMPLEGIDTRKASDIVKARALGRKEHRRSICSDWITSQVEPGECGGVVFFSTGSGYLS